MRAVQFRTGEELFELVPIRCLNDLFKCDKVRCDSSNLPINQFSSTRIAGEIPHIDCKDA